VRPVQPRQRKKVFQPVLIPFWVIYLIYYIRLWVGYKKKDWE
jgi:hypothetical protein